MLDHTYTEWYPRYYYILRNKTSQKKYIGQTTNNPGVNYFGSGIYWINHCKSHGGYCKSNIELLWCEYFENKQNAEDMLSKFENDNPNYYITDNDEWANLIPESTENNPFANMGEYQKQRISEGNHPFCNKETYEKRWTKEHKLTQSKVTRDRNIKFWSQLNENDKKRLIEKIRKSNVGKKSKYNGVPRTDDEKKSISHGTKKAMNDPNLKKHLSEKAKSRCATPEFKARNRERNLRRICCAYCGFETGLSSLPSHQRGSKCNKK